MACRQREWARAASVCAVRPPATVSLDGRSGSFTQEQRQVLASAPLAFLPTEDVIAYYAQPADRATINLNQTRGARTPSSQ